MARHQIRECKSDYRTKHFFCICGFEVTEMLSKRDPKTTTIWPSRVTCTKCKIEQRQRTASARNMPKLKVIIKRGKVFFRRT